jgi:histidinol-phosphate aminotransferase
MIKNIAQNVREEIKTIPTEEYASDSKPDHIKADLSLNINPFGVSEKVMKKLKELGDTKIYRYYPENKELIKLIAEYIKVNPENILIGDGCDGCLEMIAKTFIVKNDNVVIPIPTFHRYEFHTKLMGGKCIFVPMKNFSFDAELILREAKKNNAKIIFLCNPNNPTGIEIEKKEKIKLIKNFQGLVVVDEALADITAINGSNLIKENDNLIVVRSFSKSFGLASLRIGYIVANQNIINIIRKVSSPFKVNGVAQELAIEALQDKEHIKKSINYLNTEREFLIKELEKIGLLCTKSITTNFLVNIEKLGNVKYVINKLQKKGVMVTDTSFFKVSENKYIRVAVSSRKENRFFIKTIREIVDE